MGEPDESSGERLANVDPRKPNKTSLTALDQLGLPVSMQSGTATEGIQKGSSCCIQRSVKRGDVRICDPGEEIIPRGTPFRSGWTTPAAVSGGDPATRPAFNLEADGTARLDLCRKCVDASETLIATTRENVDPLH